MTPREPLSSMLEAPTDEARISRMWAKIREKRDARRPVRPAVVLGGALAAAAAVAIWLWPAAIEPANTLTPPTVTVYVAGSLPQLVTAPEIRTSSPGQAAVLFAWAEMSTHGGFLHCTETTCCLTSFGGQSPEAVATTVQSEDWPAVQAGMTVLFEYGWVSFGWSSALNTCSPLTVTTIGSEIGRAHG